MSSLAMRLSPRTKLTIEVILMAALVLAVFCVSASAAYADPISDVTTGGTVPKGVATPMRNFVATSLIVLGAIAVVGTVLMGVIFFFGGQPKFAKVGLIGGLVLIGVIAGISGFAELVAGVFTGLFGTSAPAAPVQ